MSRKCRRHRTFRLLVGANLLGLLGCSSGGGGDKGNQILDGALLADMEHEAGIWDARRDDAAPPDLGVLPDTQVPDAAPPPTCLRQGATLAAQPVGDPIPGLTTLRADVDADGDGKADIVLGVVTDAGAELRFLKGLDATPLGVVSGAAGHTLSLVSTGWPVPDLIAPIPVGGANVWLVLDETAGGSTLRTISAGDFSESATWALPGPVAGVLALSGGGTAVALLNFADGGCGHLDLSLGDAPTMVESCHVRPGWDLNGDGTVDFVVEATGAAFVLDGITRESLGEVAGQQIVLGFNPVSLDPGAEPGGAADFRGQGPEIASARLEHGTIRVAFHDPATLMLNEDTPAITANYLTARFYPSHLGLRLWTESQVAAAHRISVFEVRNRQSRAELGPFVNVEWWSGLDANDDGFEDVIVRAGPRTDGTNADLVVHDAADAAPVLTLPSDPSARYEPVLLRHNGLGRVTDLDGCDGADVVLIRAGILQPSGAHPARLEVYSTDGRRVFQTDSSSVRVHAAVLADLDGSPPAEIVEIKSEDTTSARLTVYRAP